MSAGVSEKQAGDALTLAQQLKADVEEKYTPEQVVASGEEVGVPAPFVVEGLKQVLAEAHKKEQEVERRRNQILKGVRASAFVIAMTSLILSCMSLLKVSMLGQLDGQVRVARAQLYAVRDLRNNSERYYAEHPQMDGSAELRSAASRVNVAIRRYNLAAGAYNEACRGAAAWLARRVISYPASYPMEVR